MRAIGAVTFSGMREGSLEVASSAHYLHSSAREKLLEHVFVGELLRTLWCQGVHDVEVLRSDVDHAGYDIVIECRSVLRHIQLKASSIGSKVSRQLVNTGIERKSSGCVVWLMFDPKTMELESFRWLGGKPGQKIPPLGDRIARHTKGNSKGEKTERPAIRVVSKGRFDFVNDMPGLAQKLFFEDLKCQASSDDRSPGAP